MRQTLTVQRLSLDELDAEWREVEEAVDATPEIDRWCSGPDWVIPVHRGFAPGSETFLMKTEGGYGLLARYHLADGRSMIAGLEPLWGFASPVVGRDVAATTGTLAHHLAADRRWDVLLLAGMPTPDGPSSFTPTVVGRLGWLGEVRVGLGIIRRVADLSGGYDPWWARRSSRFRRNIRHAEARAARCGVDVIDVSDEAGVFERLLAIEARSWKGAEESGITSPEMSATYRSMVDRLQARGRARIRIARLGGRDVGYILGGVRSGRYRGLQISYVEEVAPLSIGHLLQHREVEALGAAGDIVSYDLGMDLDYKRRWADRAVQTFTLVVERRR